MGEAGVVVKGAGGDGAGAVLPFSAQRVQVVIVLVIKLVFTMMEVLPLMTVVEVTGQLVKVV